MLYKEFETRVLEQLQFVCQIDFLQPATPEFVIKAATAERFKTLKLNISNAPLQLEG